MSQLSHLWVQLGGEGGAARTGPSHLRDFTTLEQQMTTRQVTDSILLLLSCLFGLFLPSWFPFRGMRGEKKKDSFMFAIKRVTRLLFFCCKFRWKPRACFRLTLSLFTPASSFLSPHPVTIQDKTQTRERFLPSCSFLSFLFSFISSCTVILYWLTLAEGQCSNSARGDLVIFSLSIWEPECCDFSTPLTLVSSVFHPATVLSSAQETVSLLPFPCLCSPEDLMTSDLRFRPHNLSIHQSRTVLGNI